MFDAVAVSIDNSEILWVDPNHDFENAEAITHMAVARQGVTHRFFVVAKAGMYKAGDKYTGRGYVDMPKTDPNYIHSGGMMFPRGKRGL